MPEITQEELDLLTRYKELGTVEELNGELEEKQQMARTTLLVDAAQASGYKYSVLERLTNGLELSMNEGKAFIGDKPIEEYANENWQDFLPSLTREETDKKVKFVSQSKAATKPVNQSKNVVSRYIKNTYAAKAS